MGKNRRKEWEDAIRLMTDEELAFVCGHPDGYYPGFYKMVMERGWYSWNAPYHIPENKAMMNAIIDILNELGCQCDYDDEFDELCVFYHGSNFSVSISDDFEYIKIIDNSWKSMNLDDSVGMEKIIYAINRTNIWSSVTIAYILDREEQTMEVFSFSNIPYFPNRAYLEKSLHSKLLNMLSSHELLDYFLQEEAGISIQQGYSDGIAS